MDLVWCIFLCAIALQSQARPSEVESTRRESGGDTATSMVLRLPKSLGYEDHVELVNIKLAKNPQSISISLVTGEAEPDYKNVACRVQAHIGGNVSMDIINDGHQHAIEPDIIETHNYIEANDGFNFKFTIKKFPGSKFHKLANFLGTQELEDVTLQHILEDINYIVIEGDVQSLDEMKHKFGSMVKG